MGHDSPAKTGEGITPKVEVENLGAVAQAAAPSPDEPIAIEFPLESPSTFRSSVDHEIMKARSNTENLFLKVAIWSVSVSPIVVFIALHWLPLSQTVVSEIYERWLTVLGPLLGTAFGLGIAKKGGQ